MSEEEGIPLAKFLHVVGQLKFRGTSVLFRLPRSPVKKKTKNKDSTKDVSTAHSGDGADSMSEERSGDAGKSPQKPGRKSVGFAGPELIRDKDEEGGGGGGKGEGEEKMEVGGEGVNGGVRVEEVDGRGGEGMQVAPDETLLGLPFPVVKVVSEGGREETAADIFSDMEGDEFTLATHFVKVSASLSSRMDIILCRAGFKRSGSNSIITFQYV